MRFSIHYDDEAIKYFLPIRMADVGIEAAGEKSCNNCSSSCRVLLPRGLNPTQYLRSCSQQRGRGGDTVPGRVSVQ